jgi:hypothetical protein
MENFIQLNRSKRKNERKKKVLDNVIEEISIKKLEESFSCLLVGKFSVLPLNGF